MVKKSKGQNKVTIYPDWCKGCGICVEFCPGKVLELSMHGKAVVVNEENCIKCGFCELHCPDFAIVVKDKQPVKKTQSESADAKPTDKKATGKGAK